MEAIGLNGASVSAYQGEDGAVSVPHGLRPAGEEDCEFLWRLMATTMRDYVAAVAEWDELLRAQQFWCEFVPTRWRILTMDGSAIGGCASHRHPQALYLSDLYLLPEYQGRGIGSTVIGQLADEARELGVPLILQVLDSNPRARSLYERLGFSFVCPSPMPHYSLMVAHP